MSLPIAYEAIVMHSDRPVILTQLKDGSVYITTADKPSGHDKRFVYSDCCLPRMVPVSRSFAGQALKERMKTSYTRYVESRKLYKNEMRVAYSSGDYTYQVSAETYKKDAEMCMDEYKHIRACWDQFKKASARKLPSKPRCSEDYLRVVQEMTKNDSTSQ